MQYLCHTHTHMHIALQATHRHNPVSRSLPYAVMGTTSMEPSVWPAVVCGNSTLPLWPKLWLSRSCLLPRLAVRQSWCSLLCLSIRGSACEPECVCVHACVYIQARSVFVPMLLLCTLVFVHVQTGVCDVCV